VTRIDPGVVSLVPELRGHERQPAEELEQWKTRVEERKVIDALTPAAITLGLLMTPAELEQLENIARNWRGRRWSPRRDRRWGPGTRGRPGGGTHPPRDTLHEAVFRFPGAPAPAVRPLKVTVGAIKSNPTDDLL